MPGMSGVFGWDRIAGFAVSRKRAATVCPPAICTIQCWASSSQRAPSTDVPNRMYRRRPYLSAT